MAQNSAGSIEVNATRLCPRCSAPWAYFLMCKRCGYDEGTPI